MTALLSAWIIASDAEVSGWSNGGYSAAPANPDYGTHDWIAEHALDWLPLAEKAPPLAVLKQELGGF